MNRKGQVLAVFVILLPVLILLLGMLFDYGTLVLEKHETDVKVRQIVTTGLEEKQSKEEIMALLYSNISSMKQVEVEVSDQVKVTIQSSVRSLFTRLFQTKENQWTISYRAYYQDDQLRVERG